MKRIAAFFCLVVLVACAQRVNDPADVQAIKDMQSVYEKASNGGSAEGVASGFYSADAQRMEPFLPVLTGRDTIRASMQTYFDKFNDEVRLVTGDVRVTEDLAVARGTYEGKASLKAGGYSAPFKGKWITAFQRQADGSWKAFWDIYNSDLPMADSLFPGEAEQALMQIERDWATANVKNDWMTLDKLLGTEFINNTDGVITTKKQMLANMKSGASKFDSGEAGEMRVLILGETAIVHGLWTEKSSLNGKDMSGTYRYTDVFIQRDGRWQAATTFATKVQ